MAGDELRLPGLERVERIGAGGFGTVYRAWQAEFGRWVAVKVMADALGGADDHRRFERERIATGSLSAHPSIVTVHDHGTTEEGRPYIVMELFEGGSLADRVASEGPLPAETVLEVGVGLAGALAAAHAADVLHRDVKPENVLFSGYGTAALADFGIARLPGATATRSGIITASLSHAPPEVLNGDAPTPATDVYGLASTLWTAAVGRAPFQRGGDEPIAALVARIVTAPPPDAAAHGIPAGLAAVLARGLAKDPAERPESAEAFGRELRVVQEQLGLATTPLVLANPSATAAVAGEFIEVGTDEVTRPRQAVRREASGMSRRRQTVLALAAVLVVAGGAGAWALTGTRSDVPVVAAPSEGEDGLDASPSARASATPNPSEPAEASDGPSSSADDVLAGRIAGFDMGSGSNGTGSDPSGDVGGPGSSGNGATDGWADNGGDLDPGTPTSTPSPTPRATASPTPTPRVTSSPSPSPSPSPAPANRAPTLSGGGDFSADERVGVSRTLTASDPDGDPLTIAITAGSLPPGLSLSGATISGIIAHNAAGGYNAGSTKSYAAKITATDPGGRSDSVWVNWTVTNTHFAMPDYAGPMSYGDGSDSLPDVGSGIYKQAFACQPGATDVNHQGRIVKQSVAAGTTVSFGVAVTFTYWEETCS